MSKAVHQIEITFYWVIFKERIYFLNRSFFKYSKLVGGRFLYLSSSWLYHSFKFSIFALFSLLHFLQRSCILSRSLPPQREYGKIWSTCTSTWYRSTSHIGHSPFCNSCKSETTLREGCLLLTGWISACIEVHSLNNSVISSFRSVANPKTRSNHKTPH